MAEVNSLRDITTGIKTIVSPATDEIIVASDNSDQFIIKAFSDNNDIVYVGKTGVSDSVGFPLFPGDSLSLEIDHSNTNLYVFSNTSGNKIGFIYGSYKDF